METTKIERKEKALEVMKQLDIYTPYINGFMKTDKVCFFEGFGGFWVYQEPEIEEKMKEIENKYNCTCYAITHEITDFGELCDFLIIPNDKEDWDSLVTPYENNSFYAFAYVWNKDDEFSSELGDISIKSFGGGIRRIG